MLNEGRIYMLKKHKSKIIIISLFAIGIILILVGSFKGSIESKEEFSSENYTKMLENKLEKFLLTVDGINKVNVLITLDTSSEQVYAQNQSSFDFLTINNSGKESPVYVTEIYPTIRGIAITCSYGDRDDVKMKITRLVSAYLGVSSNRIEIVGAK